MAELRVDFEPLHVRLKRKLKDLIESGYFRRGERLPAEAELKEMLGVSRATLREALKALQEEGVIVARQGIGTFVNDAFLTIKSGLEEMRGVTEMLEHFGLQADKIDTRIGEEPADPNVAELLSVPPGTPLWVIERVRTADRVPVVYSVNKLTKTLVGEEIQRLPGFHSLAQFLREVAGRWESFAVANILPVENPGEIRARMGLAKRVPFLLLEQVLYTQRNEPYLYCLDYYRCDIFKFHVVRRRR